MKNDTKAIEWSDITNNVLGFLGKYILLPLVVLGGIVSLLGNGAIGLLILVGACVLFLLVALEEKSQLSRNRLRNSTKTSAKGA